MKLVAFDLGMHVGWASGTPDARPSSGLMALTPCKGDYGRLLSQFDDFILSAIKDADFVAYESPIVHPNNTLNGIMIDVGLATHLEFVCHEIDVPVMAPYPNAIKKTFTGNGGAKKDAMVAKAAELGHKVARHDEADAIGCWYYLLSKYDQHHKTTHFSDHMDPLFNGAPDTCQTNSISTM